MPSDQRDLGNPTEVEANIRMQPRQFFLKPSDYGLPTRDELVAYRIWDNHFHGFLAPSPAGPHPFSLPFGPAPNGPNPVAQYEQNNFYVERMGIERSICQEIGGTVFQPFATPPYEAEILRILERDRDRLSGRTPVDPGYPDESCAKIEKWVRNGPCIGLKYQSSAKGVTCSHPSNDPIMRLVAEIGCHIYVHTWMKAGGKPRLPGGANDPGEATPMDVAKLAQRFPEVPIICGHSGGDWELGVRTIRPYKNVFLEYAGSDPHSGMVEFGIKHLGADRLVWGGHGPSRSYATEIGKVLDADISRDDRLKIFGGNLRRICAPIFRKKGLKLEV